MPWYDIDIYVGRPSSIWDTTLGMLAPGRLQSWGYDYGADTQRGTHPPRPPTFSFELLLGLGLGEPEWLEGDRCIARFSYPGQAAFTYFVGALEQPTFNRATGRTIVSCRAYGLLAFLPENVSLEVREDDATGTLFDALLEASGLPAGVRRVDSTLDRVLERYLASETNLVKELQRIVDTQGPPGIWYQTWDGAILAHARGMLTDALTVGGIADLQPRGVINQEHDLRNIVNFVSVDLIDVNVNSSTGSVVVQQSSAEYDGSEIGGQYTTRSAVLYIAGITDHYDYLDYAITGGAMFVGAVNIGTHYVVTARGARHAAFTVTARAMRYDITTETTTFTTNIVERHQDSIDRFGVRTLNRAPFGGLDEQDVRDLARAFLRQYAFGLTQRSFDIRITPDNIDTLLGDGADFSGLYIGRPIVIVNKDVAALGRISRVSIGANSPVLVARIETDSYVSGELIFVPSSFTRELQRGATYSIQIP